ncbi:TSUP family transporter [Arcobacter nitrofigilis]|uniref:TSUP family transporter n=1 Tax=Arcobacter nitrofigilis TaxID=28199 RepID=UPI0005A21CF5|nr:TSUP family transporter [Arcobacter nitrofigilis]
MDIILVVILTSIIQSLFGVGVLLFGTPLLLLFDYPFSEILLILLPISALINLLQIIKYHHEIDTNVYKNILFLTIPFIILSLIFISKNNVNINLIIGLFLIIIALKEHIKTIEILLNQILNFNKIFYITMGIIHGITNLGGALLTAKIFSLNANKYKKRTTSAISYMTFAIFQIITIIFLGVDYKFHNLLYVCIGIITYLIINKFLFNKIPESNYTKLFSIFLLASGILLLTKENIW